MPNTLERKIYFYRANIDHDESGRPLNFNPMPALKVINNLPFTNDATGKYEFDIDGNALCLVDHTNNSNPCIRFCRIRRTGLPQLEQAGRIRELNLGPDTGLLEAIHVVFFPDNIVGSEYNHFGPRLSRLGSYLHEKSDRAVPRATFRHLLRGDAAQQLDRLTEIRLLDMSIHPAFADIVRQADRSLADALDANSRVLDDPETVQIVIKPKKQSRISALDKLKSLFMQLQSQNGFLQNVDRFQLRGKCVDTDSVETIDLLKDQLITTKSIVRLSQRSRALDPNSAFQSIHEAYKELHNDLSLATDISP